jgi:hypothetical protein
VIYNLNGETHWELSPELMRELVSIIDGELLTDQECQRDMRWPDRILIELCNFRSALECELQRIEEANARGRARAAEIAQRLKIPYDGSDLI